MPAAVRRGEQLRHCLTDLRLHPHVEHARHAQRVAPADHGGDPAGGGGGGGGGRPPDLLVLDEPMTGLDVVSRERILDVMRAEREQGRTVVFSTHDMSEAAGADLVVLLAGRVVAVGPPSEVLTERHLLTAYRGRVIGVDGVTVLDDPHHHGGPADRHDGHVH